MRKWFYPVAAAAAVICLVMLDQLTKYLAVRGSFDDVVIIPGVFELSYIRNEGAAFGILQQKTLFFIVFTILMLVLLILLYLRIPLEKGYGWIRFSLILIISGACGNLIDRIWHGYVIDFLYFSLIDFPVFNVADSYVVCGVFLFILLYIVQHDKLDHLLEKKET